MKKSILILILIAITTISACLNSTAETKSSDSITVDTTAIDSFAIGLPVDDSLMSE